MNEKINRTQFKSLSSVTLVSGAGSTAISPANLSRLSTIADTYEMYRFVKLKYRLQPNLTRTGMQAAAYYPGIVDNAPSTVGAVADSLYSTLLGTAAAKPSDWVNVPRQSLQGYFPWYKTLAGTLDPSEEVQGNIYVCGTGTEIVYIEFEGVVEFKAPAAAVNTPMIRKAQLLEREKQRLLQILAAPPKGETGKGGK